MVWEIVSLLSDKQLLNSLEFISIINILPSILNKKQNQTNTKPHEKCWQLQNPLKAI